MTLRILAVAGMLLAAAALQADDAKDKSAPVRIDFASDKVTDNPAVAKGTSQWEYKSTWGVPDGKFSIVADPELGVNVLKLESDKASGTLLYYKLIGKLDLNKTPIIRWKWKVTKLPAGGDGRYESKDDQAIDIYAGFGRILRKSVSYRWETDTPVDAVGTANYAKVVTVKWRCLRNKETPLNTWQVDERNLAEDFKAGYGEVPSDIVLSLSVNSQYTGTQAEAYLESIEFLPLSQAGKQTPLPKEAAK